jgi:O-antigen/teichoic acid export membrane protein
MSSLNRSVASGAAWMLLLRFADRAVGLASTLILARLLLPADFGMVAMATSLTGLVELFGAFGFDVALIRERDITPRQLNCAWSMNVVLGIALPAAMLVLSWPMSQYYHEPRLPAAVALFAAGTFIGSLENVGIVEFRRSLTFRREFRFQLGKRVSGFFVTIVLALLLRSYWAMIWGAVAGRLAGVLLSYAMHPFRPRFTLNGVRPMLRFSRWLLINNVIVFVKERGSNFVIGRINGPGPLGLFTMGYDLANLPTADLVAPVARAVFPAYARLVSQPSELRKLFVSVISVTAFLAVPAGCGLAALAPLVAQVLLGPRWLGTATILQIIAFHGVLESLQSNVYATYLALGRPDMATRIELGRISVLLILTVWLASGFGILGAAYACLAVAAVFGPLNICMCTHMLALPVTRWAAAVWRSVLSALTMFLVLRPVAQSLTAARVTGTNAFWGLLGCVLLGGIVYALTAGTLWILSGRPNGAESTILARLAPRSLARD